MSVVGLHVACTTAEAIGVVLLFVYQGVLGLRWPPLAGCALWNRVMCRVLSCPHRRPGRPHAALVCISLAGSAALVSWGLLTKFLRLRASIDWSWAGTAGLNACMVGCVEEFLFRGLLIRKCSGEQAASAADRCVGACRSRVRLLAPAREPQAGTMATPDNPCALEVMLEGPGDAGAQAGPGAQAAACQPLDAELAEVVGRPSNEASLEATDAKQLAVLASPALGSRRPPVAEQLAALAIFVVYHLDMVHTMEVFRDCRFLGMAAVLGVCCQEALLNSWSLWPGIVMHSFWVWAWLAFSEDPEDI